MSHELIIILDLDSRYSRLIARRIREHSVYCEIMPYGISYDTIKKKAPKGLILAGESVVAEGANAPEIIDALAADKIPVWLVDSPDDASLHNFLMNTCGVKADWNMNDYAEEQVERLRARIGDQKVLCALSGGVDSSVAAVMLHKAVGNNLTCIFVDHGLMRLDEGDEVESFFKGLYGANFIRIDAQERFLMKLKGVTDPEAKRKIIGEEFIRVFEEEARKIGTVDFFVQGTIYPDVIESGTAQSAVIKSHHNVGGLPDVIDFKEIVEPLRDLFKDEVRCVGLALGMPEHLVYRQPFPGPGLAVRCIGEITQEKLDVLRMADFIFRDEIATAGLDREIWQYFAILTNLRSVGVTDDQRTYGHTIALRAVHSSDAMTADWAQIPHHVLESVSTRIAKEVPSVNRIVYDITSKPPGTIEWE